MTTQTKHTPGPWTISEYPNGFNSEVIADDGRVATIAGTSSTAQETQANARLIAAAPELLAALQAILDSKEQPLLDKLERQARSAFAKARGGDD